MDQDVQIILRIKNLEDTKKQLAGVFSGEATEGNEKFEKQTKKTNKELGNTRRKSKIAGEGINDFVGKMFRSIAILGLFNRTLRLSVGLFEQSAGFQRGAMAFETAVGNVEKMLPKLQAATRGTVEDMKLLQTATRAVTEGLDQRLIVRSFQIATVSARRMGRSVEESMDLVTRAMVRNDEQALKGLGIQVEKNVAYQQLQSILGRLPGPANRVARIRATENFIMSELNKTYGGFNSLQSDSLEILEKSRAAISNFKRDLGGFVTVAMAPFLKVITFGANALGKFFRTIQQNETLTNFIGLTAGAIAGILGFSASLKALRFIIQTLNLKRLILTPLLALGPKGWAIAAAVTGVAALASTSSKTGGVLATLSTQVKVFRDLVGSYDRETGMAKALKKDQEQIKGTWGWVVKLSRAWILVKEFGSGALDVVGEKLKPIQRYIKLIGKFIEAFGTDMATSGKMILKGLIPDKIVGGVKAFTGGISNALKMIPKDTFDVLDKPIKLETLDAARKLGGTTMEYSPIGFGGDYVNKISDIGESFFHKDTAPQQRIDQLQQRQSEQVPLSDQAITAIEEEQVDKENLSVAKQMLIELQNLSGLQREEVRKDRIEKLIPF